ncbi:hypothetical protein EYF80_050989 [Liparis tanakae]|uniref:Uncharacterized protein n=1 Tax=Liparis tanakae TaxID=230148 RepID=A0A4Z2FCD2_9TELE|nr:hypothetical protein EYF80_050989 [Liparis tanakae]
MAGVRAGPLMVARLLPGAGVVTRFSGAGVVTRVSGAGVVTRVSGPGVVTRLPSSAGSRVLTPASGRHQQHAEKKSKSPCGCHVFGGKVTPLKPLIKGAHLHLAGALSSLLGCSSLQQPAHRGARGRLARRSRDVTQHSPGALTQTHRGRGCGSGSSAGGKRSLFNYGVSRTGFSGPPCRLATVDSRHGRET